VINEVTRCPLFPEEGEVAQIKSRCCYRLDRGRDRKVRMRLLGGLVVWMCSLYHQPKRRLFGKQDEERSPDFTLTQRNSESQTACRLAYARTEWNWEPMIMSSKTEATPTTTV